MLLSEKVLVIIRGPTRLDDTAAKNQRALHDFVAMKKLGKAIYIILSVVAVIVTIGSLLSVFRNTESRFLKMLDFPRIQFFIASLASLTLLIVFTKKWHWYDYLLIVGLVGGMIINGRYMIHYTSLVPVVVPAATMVDSSDDQLSILLANVKMSNRKAEPLIDLINDKNPDIILAMEVDEWWNEKLQGIEKEYSYSQETINEVAYGMILYSRYPLEAVDVRYLQNEKVPSFESTITLATGKTISFHSVHPVPPTHFKDLPDNAGQKEIAMKRIGEKIKNRKLPTIVAGDINDVVWSYVDELTGTENILYDVRVGRGFYNSYNANNFLMRWPLDYVFVTEEFRLKKTGTLTPHWV